MDGKKSNFPHEPDYFPRFYLPPSIKFPIIKIMKSHPKQQDFCDAKKSENFQVNHQNENVTPSISNSPVKEGLKENQSEETRKVSS